MSKAIFLGSFNPPHIGHATLINNVVNSGIMKILNIDKIHIIPTMQNPNKPESINFWDRYKMCCKEFMWLINDNKVIIDDIESTFDHTYTYELIDKFKNNDDHIIKSDFWWIITFETYNELLENKWKNSQSLLDNNKFIIMLYEDEYDKCKDLILSIRPNIGMRFVKMPEKSTDVSIHSSLIRKTINESEKNKNMYNKLKTVFSINDINELKYMFNSYYTLEYIDEHNLYK